MMGMDMTLWPANQLAGAVASFTTAGALLIGGLWALRRF
jgi:hypothetical protein